MIVRLMGEGQYRVDDAICAQLNELDAEAARAVEGGDEAALARALQEMAELVRGGATRVPDEEIVTSDAIVPPPDLSLEEARELFSGEGLIPDLPA